MLMVAVLASCSTQKKIVYLQDNIKNAETATIAGGEIRLQPNDMVSIFVSSRNPELAYVFNLPQISQTITSTSSSMSSGGSSSSGGVLSYTVDGNGNIDFPILGDLHVEGMTRTDLAKDIKTRILANGMIKDPIVTVEFANQGFSAIGEVNSPGVYNITKDQTNIFEALSMAGDLTINGVRNNVTLTRKVDGKLISYNLDLTTRNVYNSPAFYVQQNDVIYVQPNRIRSSQATANGNTLRSTSFWMSLASFITTMTLLIIN